MTSDEELIARVREDFQALYFAMRVHPDEAVPDMDEVAGNVDTLARRLEELKDGQERTRAVAKYMLLEGDAASLVTIWTMLTAGTRPLTDAEKARGRSLLHPEPQGEME